jgi:hypothetical protein
MDPVRVTAGDIFPDQAMQMDDAEYDHMVEKLATTGSDPLFRQFHSAMDLKGLVRMSFMHGPSVDILRPR